MECPTCGESNESSRNTCKKCGQSLVEAKRLQVENGLALVQSNPDEPVGHSQLGLAYHEMGKSQDAIRELEAAIRLSQDQSHLIHQCELADIYWDLKKWDQAVQVLANGIVEKLDKFRGSSDVTGLEEADDLLRRSYYNREIADWNRKSAPEHEGALRALRKYGFSSKEEHLEHETRPEVGTYELASRLSGRAKPQAGSQTKKGGCAMTLLASIGVIIILLGLTPLMF